MFHMTTPATAKKLLLCALFCLIGCAGFAQTFTVLHHFTTNYDGGLPLSGLIAEGNTLYGTTRLSGPSFGGTIYKVNLDGSGYTVLHFFDITNGGSPEGGLVLNNGTLYGTTPYAGTNLNGMIFKIATDGTGFSMLTNLPNGSLGSWPRSSLVYAGEKLYGCMYSGGGLGWGGLFQLNTDGSGYTLFKTFSFSGSDGNSPIGDLILDGETFYGTTSHGGGSGSIGTVFKVQRDGTGFSTLFRFSLGGSIQPLGKLLLSDGWLYGTLDTGGGANGAGAVFKMTAGGSNFVALKTFFTIGGPDGSFPHSGVVKKGQMLFGTTNGSGSGDDQGTIFVVRTDGSGFAVLKHFDSVSTNEVGVRVNSDGMQPAGSLLLAGNVLYGVTSLGGLFGQGTIFSYDLTPQIQMDSFGIQSNGFGFKITAVPGTTVVVETCELASGSNWGAIQTNVAGVDPISFNDSNSSNFVSRYYRLRMQ
jgi:uncharacterized repeat protein (TIGR03803 family)